MQNLIADKSRYCGSKMPRFQYYFRKSQESRGIVQKLYRILFAFSKRKNHIDLFYKTHIGAGLYIGHPYAITINADSIIGSNVNIHKGVTIGQENRGKRAGSPVIGNDVWIGINSTIVGNITIGDDVLIAPNSFVNVDIPCHSIVLGNPCIIKSCKYATEKYISNRYEELDIIN